MKTTDPRFADWWQENSKEAYGTGPANAARNLVALAATRTTGTGVAGDQGAHRVSKPRGADRRTRRQRRAGGATLRTGGGQKRLPGGDAWDAGSR